MTVTVAVTVAVAGVAEREKSATVCVSAGEVLLVTFGDGTLIRFDAAGAQTLGGGVHSASVAFGPFGEVDEIVFQDGRLIQFDATGVSR